MKRSAASVAQEARLWQQVGRTGRRRRIPQQQLPTNIERAYAKQLRSVFVPVERALAPLLEALPRLTRASRREILRDDRMDATALEEALAMVQAAMVQAAAPDTLAQDLAANIAAQTKAHQGVQFGRQVNAALGIDVFQGNAPLRTATANFMTEQVQLIKSMPAKTMSEIEGIVVRGVSAGHLHTDIAKEITKRLGIGKVRAQLIARDQVGKFYGVVNRERQTSLGMTRFRWRSVGDERVRSKHRHLDGKVFRWDKLPSEGIPGQPVNCRCSAEPVFDDILAEMAKLSA